VSDWLRLSIGIASVAAESIHLEHSDFGAEHFNAGGLAHDLYVVSSMPEFGMETSCPCWGPKVDQSGAERGGLLLCRTREESGPWLSR
jgi:hypothetical protein